MQRLLQHLLQLSTENEVVEFKQAKNQFDKDKLGQYYSALANEANLRQQQAAYLVMGVKDDYTVVGTDISDKQINDYKAEMVRHTSPRCNFSAVHETYHDGKRVLVFEIPAAPQGQPVSWKGHYYGRDGESLGALTPYEFDTIRSQIGHQDWSAQIIDEAGIEDLLPDAIAFARAQYKEKNSKLANEIDAWDDRTFLDKAKVTIKGKVTRAAILLLGKPESEHFINPATARISWILRDKDNIEKDYEHFYNPFILAVEQVRSKIRNLKYRYIKSDSLFPDEVDQYDPYLIREALHNAIAHQDYTLGGKIVVIENEDGWLTFTNAGRFIPNSVEEVVTSDSPEPKYRNTFLVGAMVNLNMIDTIGSGIKKMFYIQRHKFFPLPEYDLSDNKVKVTFFGKVVNLNYARKLAEMPELSLEEIMLLDKVAKRKTLSEAEIKTLRSKYLIEGRKPNFHISSNVAEVTGEKASYIKQRGFKDAHFKKMIVDYLEKYGEASKKEIDELIFDLLPAVLDRKQRENKMRNILYSMSKRDKTIENTGTNRYPQWVLRLSKGREIE